MRYIITDPDEQTGIQLKKILDDFEMMAFQGSFRTMTEAENSIRVYRPDYAFIRMGAAELNAFKLSGIIREVSAFSKVIFLSDTIEYVIDAFEYRADGFLLIPIERDKVEQLLMGDL